MAAIRIALIAGASGLVGQHCLTLLLGDDRYEKVISVGRSQLPVIHPKLEQIIVDLNQLAEISQQLKANDVFCCLGTTLKKAGSKERFFKVDFTYVVELAKITSLQGASQFLVVSALGANAKSSIFYNRVKGQMEGALRQVPFRSVHIFQPSVLLGNRQESRPMERLAGLMMRALGFMLLGRFRKYRPVPALKVARAMVLAASREEDGVHVHSSETIAHA